MLDRYVVPRIKAPLNSLALRLHQRGVSADTVTVAGFAVGVLATLAAALNEPGLALVLLIINRLADGVDGELARLSTPTDAGAFLDIVLDFVFYALFPIGFAYADPAQNALPAALLVASFVGTGASFLAFASQAERHGLSHPEFDYKGLYYLDGLAEGTETVLCFALMCLLPQWFAAIALSFAALCTLTAVSRVHSGYRTIRRRERM